MTRVVCGAASDRGLVRSANEDRYAIAADLAAVADGMGGHAAGEVASRLAIEHVELAWREPALRARLDDFAAGAPAAPAALLGAVRDGVLRAHRKIVAAAREDRARAGMGTTFTGFVLAGGAAVFAHVGDSRAYLVRDGVADRLTDDHTVAALRRAATADEDTEPERRSNMLTSALGIGDSPRVASFALRLADGDRLVLITDGVSEYVSRAELAVRATADDPGLAAAALVELALARGGEDNATAVVARVDGAHDAAPAIDQATLAGAPLFDGLGLPERLRVTGLCTSTAVARGGAIPATIGGERVAHIVLSGEADGAAPGELIYPTALVGDVPRPARLLRASSDLRLLTLRGIDFLALGEEEPELGVKLFAALARLLAR